MTGDPIGDEAGEIAYDLRTCCRHRRETRKHSVGVEVLLPRGKPRWPEVSCR